MLRQNSGIHRFDEISAESYKPLAKAVDSSFSFAGKNHFIQRCRHFSFIYDRTKPVSFGSNTLKTHPWNLRFSYLGANKEDISSIVGTHSELRAVIRAGLKDFKGMTMINTRINRNDELDYSFPCKGCFDMLERFGFKEVFYTVKGGSFGRVKFF